MEISNNKSLICPQCGNNTFELRRTATYQYTYQLDLAENHPWLARNDSLPFLFDNREQIKEEENIICKSCHSTFPCSLNKNSGDMKLIILQKALRSDHQASPEFLG